MWRARNFTIPNAKRGLLEEGEVNCERIMLDNSTRKLKLHEALFIALLILVVFLLPVLTIVTVAAANEGLDSKITQPCPRRDPRMDPTYEKRYGQDVVWQIPPNPKAILFMAHGGFKEPLSYFDRGPKCQLCYGLPEDRAVVLEALHRGYAVLTLKSIAVAGYDIFPIEASKDLVIATRVIPEWARDHSLESLPLLAWGHSAGGYFVTALTLKLPIRALVLMCIEGLPGVEKMASPLSFPPTFFAYMPLDTNIHLRVAEAMAILRERGVKIAEKQCWPKPLSPLFFMERIPCMSGEMSQKVYWAYKAAGWLDSSDYLTKRPNTDDWEAVLWKANALPFCEESGDLCLARHVEQELQMAAAWHSLTSDANGEIYLWLDSKVLSSNESVTQLSASE